MCAKPHLKQTNQASSKCLHRFLSANGLLVLCQGTFALGKSATVDDKVLQPYCSVKQQRHNTLQTAEETKDSRGQLYSNLNVTDFTPVCSFPEARRLYAFCAKRLVLCSFIAFIHSFLIC